MTHSPGGALMIAATTREPRAHGGTRNSLDGDRGYGILWAVGVTGINLKG